MAWKATTTKNIGVLECVLAHYFPYFHGSVYCSTVCSSQMFLAFWASGVGVFIGISVPGGDFSSKVLQSFCFPAGLGDPFPFPSSIGSSWEWEHLAFPRCRRAEPG